MRLPPGLQGLGKVSERPVALQRRAPLTVACAAVAVQVTGHAGNHVQSAGRSRRRSVSGVFKCADCISAVFGFDPCDDFAAGPHQLACSRQRRKAGFMR